MTQRVTVTESYIVEFDGTLEAYVELADSQVLGGLPEKDAGDATGFYVQEFQRLAAIAANPLDARPTLPAYDPETHTMVMHDAAPTPITVTVRVEQDFFVWEPPLS